MKWTRPLHAAAAILANGAVIGGILAATAWGAESAPAFRFFIPSDVAVEEKPPATEAAFTQATTGEGGAYGVRIELELSRAGAPFRTVPLGTPLCNGDFVAFRFTPTAPGWATVVNHGTSGRWSTLWPASPTDDARITPARPVRIPDLPGSGFPVSGPAGAEYVMVFLSPTPFSAELKKLQDRVLAWEEPPQAMAEAVTGGGLRAVTLLRDLGQAQAVYAVGQGEQTVAFTLDHRATCGG